ncbi:uncharacterized protein LOC142578486 [Dermacentor variabilis]|uniref:uncharacterized protein LOC142578486 n=1 Tax=Dermacentor variabilis TaxID=34621 RepID=UPI003F5C01C2
MHSNAAPLSPRRRRNTDVQRGGREGRAPAASDGSSGVRHSKTCAASTISRGPSRPQEQVSSPDGAQVTSPGHVSPRQPHSPGPATDRGQAMDVNDQRHMQLSVFKSGPKKSGAKQRHKQRRAAASSPRPDSTRNHRSPQPITANKAAANELLSNVSSPSEAAPSAGAVLSSPSGNVGSSSPTESPHLADTHVTSPPAPAEDVVSPTKQSGRRRRESDKERNKHEVRTSAAPRSGPASSSKAAKATGRFAVPGFLEVPAAKTSQGAAEQITSAPLSSDERQSRDEPEKRGRADAGNDLMSPPTEGSPEAMGETVPTKSTLKGPVRRVSIWGEDFRKGSGSGQEEARNAMKKWRLSRASFKDPMATEDIGTSRTTRSTIASIMARMNRKMSMRSTVDTTARSFIPEHKSTLFMASVVFMAILCSVTAATLLFFVTRSDPAAQVACRASEAPPTSARAARIAFLTDQKSRTVRGLSEMSADFCSHKRKKLADYGCVKKMRSAYKAML